MPTDKRLKEKLEVIAKQHLQIETLKERKRDHLDFTECSVWGIQAALEAAYRLGVADAEKQHPRTTR